MTKTYAQLRSTIAKLEKEAAALREAEMSKVIAQIKERIAAFGLTVEHLFGREVKAAKAGAGRALVPKAARKGAGIPKYRDPKTGKTWTGFGKAPGWIATARNRDKFLFDQTGVIAEPAVKQHAESAAAAAKKVTRKARKVAVPPKKSIRAKKAVPASVAGPEIKAEEPAAKSTAAKKSASLKKAAPAKKAANAPKAAATASKAARSRPVAKTRSPRSTAKAAAPVVTSDAPEVAGAGTPGSR